MRIYTLLVGVLLLNLASPTSGQTQLHLQSGITASSFFYKNSQGESAKDLQYLIGNYTALGCDANFGGHFIRPALGFRQAGAITYISRTKVKWDIKYIDLHFGYGYNYYRGKRVMLGIGAGINLGVMLNGQQTTGSETYNLLKEKAMRQIDLGANGFANAKIKMAEGVYLSLEYRYNVSILNIETDSKSPQTTRNQSHNFLAGIAINLSNPAKAPKPVSPVFDSIALKADTTAKATLPSNTPPPAVENTTKAENTPATSTAPATEPEKNTVTAETKPADQEAKPTTGTTKLAAGSRLVVIAAVVKETDAQAMADGIKAKGYPGGYLWIPDYEPTGRPMYRVYAGPYNSAAGAKNVQIQLKGLYPYAYYYETK